MESELGNKIINDLKLLDISDSIIVIEKGDYHINGQAIKRIVNKPNSNYKNFQVGYIALNKNGDTGCYSIQKGFSMTKYRSDKNVNIASDSYIIS